MTKDGGNLKRNFEREGVVVAEVAYSYDEENGSLFTLRDVEARETYTFTGTKAYVVSTVDPGHGEMSVYVDGQKVADVQTKNASRKRSQKVFETGDLAPGQHTITLVNKTGEPIATEGIYTLNNDSKGMFELESTSYEVEKGKPVTVKIKRVGGSKGGCYCSLYHRTWNWSSRQSLPRYNSRCDL